MPFDAHFPLRKSEKETVVTGRIPKARALWMYEHLMAHPEVRDQIVSEHVVSRSRGDTASDGQDHDSKTYEVLVMRFLASAANNPNADGTFDMTFRPSKHGYGRRYSNRVNSIQTQGLSRKVRHTLLKGVARDYDGVACFQVIARQLCQKNNISWPSLDNYVDNLSSIIKMAEAEGCGKPTVKNQHLRVLHNGASSKTKWPTKSVSLAARLTQFKAEADVAIPQLVNDTALGAMVQEKIIDRFESSKDAKARAKAFDKEGGQLVYYKNPFGRNIGLQCQNIEDALLTSWAKTVNRFGGDLRDLCFDGLMVDEDTWCADRESEFLKQAEEDAFESTGFRVPIIHKAMDEGFTIPPEELEACEARVAAASEGGDLVALDDKWKKAVKGDVGFGEEKCEAVVEFETKANTFVVKDLTTMNKGADMVFANDVAAGRFLGYQFAKEGTILPVKVSNDSALELYVHNPSLSNLISKSDASLLNVVESMKGLRLKGRGDEKVQPNHAQSKSICDVIRTYAINTDLADDIFARLNSETCGKVFFRNGYYDLAKGRLVSREEDGKAVAMVRVERDFYDESEWSALSWEHPAVMEVYKHVIEPFGTTDIERMGRLRVTGRAIGGHFLDRSSRNTIEVGDRRSSKGTHQTLLVNSFGQFPNGYVSSGTAPVVPEKGVSDPALANKELISSGSHIARIRIMNETPNLVGVHGVVCLDGEAVKAREGCDPITGRLLYGQDTRFVPISFDFMAMNGVPPIRGAVDCMDFTAYFNMPYQFVEPEVIAKCKNIPCLRPSDPTIKDKCRNPEWIKAFTWMVFNSWKPIPFDPKGPEVSDRNRELRAAAFKELTKDKVEGVFKSEHVLFAAALKQPGHKDLETYDPKEWFVPSYQVAELWRRGFEEKCSTDNLAKIIDEIKRLPPPAKGNHYNLGNERKVAAYLARMNGTVRKGLDRIKMDDKTFRVNGFHGIKFETIADEEQSLSGADDE